MDKLLEQIGSLGILPVAIVDDEKKAVILARTLSECGLPAIEVTFRTQAAASVIEQIAKDSQQMLVGAGTVLTIDQARTAIDAGARFIVSPGFNPKVIEFCLSNSIPIIPGIATPTEIQYAIEYNLEVVKFFPAEASGGTEYLKAIAAPFKEMQFIPTGGIEESTLLSYLRLPQVLACGGSWMIPSAYINSGSFDEIMKLTRKAIATMLGFELRHIGINMPNINEAKQIATTIEKYFGFGVNETNGSFFVGTQFEVLKQQYLGAKGHIAIATHFVKRAVAHLALKGINIKPETKNVQDGKLSTVYLDLEIGGFAIHLVQV
ncbi:MAG: bifunctional 4-hydroxy-2-oxoglutarate aldolase/2-dehydro-3-deoxy-phosphogluconate aldolase [Ignavibacteriales bacterium]|nr:bifunctional 4-hydroxy-2-oxoglutarate aldolase/2-dehydro-3-deoxy-phosphogluconate aldolase [Ignavibacteriales bacterium]